MARRNRDLSSSDWFHVFNRGADRQDIFSCESDFLLFERLLDEEVVGRFGVEVHAYALMSNHFHLLVRCTDGDLSSAMQRLCGRFGAAYNQRCSREGPVFTSRFKSEAVMSEAQLVQVARYIHRNPLAIVPASALHRYRWSSLGALTQARDCPAWLATGVVFETGRDPSGFLQYVLLPQASDAHGSPGPAFTCDDIEHAISAGSDEQSPSVFEAVRGQVNELRTLAITLAIELRAASVEEIARRYGVNPQSIRRTARQGRVAAATSADFARRRQSILAELHGRQAA